MKSGIPEMNHRFTASDTVKVSFDKDNALCSAGDITINEPVSVLTDDDDDESTTIKKKKTEKCAPLFKNNFSDSNLCGLATANRFYKHFSYLSSHRYILHRVIII